MHLNLSARTTEVLDKIVEELGDYEGCLADGALQFCSVFASDRSKFFEIGKLSELQTAVSKA